MFEWMTNLVQSLGALGVAFLMLLENVFPPIPSELVMPLAGFVAARGGMSFWPMVLAGAAGSLAGATLWYFIGRKIGERRLRRWVDDHGRWLTLSCDDIDRAHDWFERRGRSAVFVGRLIPGVRTFISLPAGFSGMRMASFLGYSALGTLVWTAALAFAGRLLGSQYDRVGSYLEPVSWLVIGSIVVLYIVRLVRQDRTRGAESERVASAGPRQSIAS